MTLVPLTQAAHRLGIDPKTLRRWRADAHLSLQPDPQDARKKGVSSEHLFLLAHRHQRHLTASIPEPAAHDVPSPASLPVPVLALPETLTAFQA